MKHSRKLKNYLLMPKMQLRYLYYLLALNIAPMAGLLVFAVIQFQRLRLEMATYDRLPIAILVAIDDTINRLSLGFLTCFFLVLLLLIYGSIVVSHRFAGPMYVINRHIRSIMAGDYAFHRELRKDDEMKETFELLKQLAQQLEKDGAPPPKK